MSAAPNNRGPWVAAGLTCILAIAIIVPRVAKVNEVQPQTTAQTQEEEPAPTAYVGERPPHPLDSKRDLYAEGKAWARANGLDDGTKPCIATYKVFSVLRQAAPLNQIKGRIGCEGELLSEQRIGTTRYRTFFWRGERLGTGMTLVFADHLLNSKYQTGLE